MAMRLDVFVSSPNMSPPNHFFLKLDFQGVPYTLDSPHVTLWDFAATGMDHLGVQVRFPAYCGNSATLPGSAATAGVRRREEA